MIDETGPDPFTRPTRWRRLRAGITWRRAGLGLIILVAFLLLYFPIGMIAAFRVEDEVAFTAAPPPANASHAVAMVIGLINRETAHGRWVANDPVFLPGHFLVKTPEFQQGIVAALARFTVEMGDQIGRTRGSSQADPDLEKAAGLLKYPGDIWLVDPENSLAPTASSDRQYREAAAALTNYNQRLSQGQATFDPRSDNLVNTIERLAADLGSQSGALDREIHEGSHWMGSRDATRIFYGVKGRMYAYALVLRELGVDYDEVIKSRQLGPVWNQMIDSLNAGAVISPYIVTNGDLNSALYPNHLTSLGFYLLRSRTQLREVSNILQK